MSRIVSLKAPSDLSLQNSIAPLGEPYLSAPFRRTDDDKALGEMLGYKGQIDVSGV